MNADPHTVRKRRRWLSYSLRALLVVITVFGIWLGIKVDQARLQKRAVETLRALGAEIAYEHQRVKYGFDTKIDLDVPAWARELCGDDFFQTVKGVYFWRQLSDDRKQTIPQAITDEDLKCLADLPHLEVLHVDKAPITDAGLAHLPHPERLTTVTLDYTNVGDDFVRRLRGAKQLEHLSLYDTRVTDDGLAELTDLTMLKVVRLASAGTDERESQASSQREVVGSHPGRKITDAGLRHFKSLSRIRFLVAADCQITGEALRGFRMPNADSVYLDTCAVGDDDLPPLVGAVEDVRILCLDGCPISDRGLRHLKHLGKTQVLQLSKTKIQGSELRHLASLSGLAILALSGCPLDDPDLKSLEPLYTGAALGGSLMLDDTPIADDDLAKISGFVNLTHLGLSRTKITDAGLPHLYKLTKLAELDLGGTKVTHQGIKELLNAIPGFTVVSWDGQAK